MVSSHAVDYCASRSAATPLLAQENARTLTPTHPSRFRRWAKRGALALFAAALFAGAASMLLPNVPLNQDRSTSSDDRVVGAVHMHTRLSDGSGTVDDLVEAAVSEGLDFIVVSDHNTAEPTRYEYRRGVLVIVAEELSAPTGHVMLLDVDTVRASEPDSTDRAFGFPLHRPLGDAGLLLVSHPNGRRYWRDRSLSTVDGAEIWNADSEWRNDTVLDWIEALTLLPFRPALGMMALVDRPDRNLALIDSVSAVRDIATTCAVDAHARIRITDDFLIPFPSYRMTLGLVQHHLRLTEPLTGDAERDGAIVTESLRRGEGYCAIGGVADAAAVRIEAAGEELIVAVPPAVESARIRIYRDGTLVEDREGPELRLPVSEPGSYRVEIDVRARLLRARRLPWILSAPIRVGRSPDDPPTSVLGGFEDDYGNRHEISDTVWQDVGTRYRVEEWRASQQYLIARLDDASAPGATAWARIDWVLLGDGSPWAWAFCISDWDAHTYAEARASGAADRADLRTGCGGFPFSRMRPIP